MKFKINKRDLIIIISLIFLINSVSLSFLNFNLDSYKKKNEIRKNPNSSQIEPSENIRIEVKNYSHLIWFTGNIIIEASSNISGYLRIDLSDENGGAYFQNFQDTPPISNTSENEIYEIPILPQPYSFPGRYNILLTVDYLQNLNSTDEDTILSIQLQINIGLGLPMIIVLTIVFMIAFALIITKKEVVKEDILVGEPEKQLEIALDAPEGKIKCPECKKTIEEGLSFCPECGKRIPEFLRYHPETTSSI